MKSFRLVLIGTAVVVLATFFSAFSQLYLRYDSASHQVCQLVRDNYYLQDEKPARLFAKLCEQAADDQSFLLSKDANIKRINDRLSYLRVSHLALYNPDENRWMWENQGLDTGLRARLIDDKMVVYRLLPGSAAEEAGVQSGDVLQSLNGERVVNVAQVESGSGAYEISRAGHVTVETILPTQITEDQNPTIKPLVTQTRPHVGWLRIPSFLPQYFDENWPKLVEDLLPFDALVVDVRDNAGGSFPAMLRALSPFLCSRELVGTLYHQGRAQRDSIELTDTLDTSVQVHDLEIASQIKLKTFSGYDCFHGPVVVLSDSGTTSTAEIFTQAMHMRPRTSVLGGATAGEVVMARWFPIGDFGSADYELSIPIAGFALPDGSELEGRGAQPDRDLYYDLGAALRGEDSWLHDSLLELKRLNLSRSSDEP